MRVQHGEDGEHAVTEHPLLSNGFVLILLPQTQTKIVRVEGDDVANDLVWIQNAKSHLDGVDIVVDDRKAGSEHHIVVDDALVPLFVPVKAQRLTRVDATETANTVVQQCCEDGRILLTHLDALRFLLRVQEDSEDVEKEVVMGVNVRATLHVIRVGLFGLHEMRIVVNAFLLLPVVVQKRSLQEGERLLAAPFLGFIGNPLHDDVLGLLLEHHDEGLHGKGILRARLLRVPRQERVALHKRTRKERPGRRR